MNESTAPTVAVSVVIPTFNRSAVLAKQLDAFRGIQAPHGGVEYLVVDDGSTDNTEEVVRSSEALLPGLQYFKQPNSGPAAARNVGVRAAKGRIVLILNDDSIPDSSLLVEHCRIHDEYVADEVGVLGFCTWAKDSDITPFMTWLENGGPYFSYSGIKGEWATWRQLWTCNVSFKRDFLIECGLFDEEFPFAAWEDIELGYRMHSRGLRLYYNRKAMVWHDHDTTVESVITKMKSNGAAAVIMGRKIAEKSVLPPLARALPSLILRLLDTLVFMPWLVTAMKREAIRSEKVKIRPVLYSLLLLHYRIAGQREYLRNND